MTRGRLEAQITIPTGGWDGSLTVTAIGGPTTFTVAAGTYYPTDLLTTLKTTLDAVFGGDGAFTVTGSFGEAGTGFVTISHATQTFEINWTDLELQDVLGFNGFGDLTPAALSFVADSQCRGVWLPNAEIASAYGNADEGHTETDESSTVSPRGDVKTLSYSTRQVLPWCRWSHVLKAYARISAETTTGASFEQWWRYTQGGELSYFEVGSAVRLYWDASTSTYKTYRIPGRRGTEMPRVVDGWDGLYAIELNRLVRVPGT